MISVLLIDDHALIREGLKKAILVAGMQCVGEAASRSEARAQIAHKNPDVIVVDLNLPDGSGFDLIAWARSISKSIGIVVLTLNEEETFLLAALTAGASAYIVKSAPISDVIAAIKHSYASPLSFSAKGLSDAIKHKKDQSGLTARELDVLALLPSGGRNRALAAELFITEATLKTHLSSIYRKLAVTNRVQAVAVSRKRGLLDNS